MSDKQEDSSLPATKNNKTASRNHSKISNFAQHLTEETHSFGPMSHFMEIVQYHKKKGSHLNTIEKSCPY